MAKKKKTDSKANPAKEKDPYLSTTEFALKIGVNRSRVKAAIKSGLLSESVKTQKTKNRILYKIHAINGPEEWLANRDPSKVRDQDKQKATAEMNEKGGLSTNNYQKAKAAREFFNAKLSELEYQVKAGKLVSADRVKAESFKIARRLRDSILGVPERIAAELAVMDDPRMIAIFVKEHLADSLKDLSDLNNVARP